MRISVTIFIILISTYVVNASVLDPVIENVIHLKASKPPPGVNGIWKKKTIWKPRWVKEWKSAKVTKPVWRKVWSPVQIREWLPIPKPPPGWDLHSTPLIPVQPKPQKALPVKDSQGHDSFAVHSSAAAPLWDPVPYPESQQPPPPPPQPSFDAGGACGSAGCDNSPSFTHQAISEIIGPNYQTPDPYQNPEYSETVNHLTRLPPDGRPPQNFQFNPFPGLPEFLVPPKFQSPPDNNFRQHLTNIPVPPSPPFETVPKWTPLPPENKVRGHFITKAPDQPYKFQIPEPRNNTSNAVFQNSNVNLKERPNNKTLHALSGDFIQEAELVGEYHYSEFDLPANKQETKKQQQQQQQEAYIKQQQQQQQEAYIKQQQQQQQEAYIKQQQQQEAYIKQQQQQEAYIKQQQQEAYIKQRQQQQQEAYIKQQQQNKEVKIKQQQDKEVKIKQQQDKEVKVKQQQKATAEQKPKPVEEKPKQPEVKVQGGTHVQKKHVPDSTWHLPNTNLNYQQQEAIIKEIFKHLHYPNQTPDSKPPPATNPEKLQNHSPKPQPNPESNSSPKKNIYPVYERVKDHDTLPDFLPPNHRFSQPPEKQLPANATKLIPVTSEEPPRTESPSFGKSSIVQLVFAAPADDSPSAEGPRKTTTTEPYEIVFSSSLLSTTEAVTKSPVIIVTPANSGKS